MGFLNPSADADGTDSVTRTEPNSSDGYFEQAKP